MTILYLILNGFILMRAYRSGRGGCMLINTFDPENITLNTINSPKGLFTCYLNNNTSDTFNIYEFDSGIFADENDIYNKVNFNIQEIQNYLPLVNSTPYITYVQYLIKNSDNTVDGINYYHGPATINVNYLSIPWRFESDVSAHWVRTIAFWSESEQEKVTRVDNFTVDLDYNEYSKQETFKYYTSYDQCNNYSVGIKNFTNTELDHFAIYCYDGTAYTLDYNNITPHLNTATTEPSLSICPYSNYF